MSSSMLRPLWCFRWLAPILLLLPGGGVWPSGAGVVRADAPTLWRESWTWQAAQGGGGFYTAGNTWPQVAAVAIDGSGNAIAAGLARGSPLDVPPGNGLDGFVARLDRGTGNVVWKRLFGSNGEVADSVLGLALGASGEIYVVGAVGGAMTGVEDPAPGNSGMLLARLGPDGSLGWVRKVGLPGWNVYVNPLFAFAPQRFGIALDSSGNVHAAGIFYNASNASIAKVVYVSATPEGTLRWVREAGSEPFQEEDVRLTRGSDGNIYMAGVTRRALAGPQVGDADIFLARIDPGSGGLAWLSQFGTAANESLGGIVAWGTRLYVAGGTDGLFPDNTDEARGDSFLAATDLNGSIVWVRQYEAIRPCDYRDRAFECIDGARAVALWPDGSTIFVLSHQWHEGARPRIVAFSPSGTRLFDVALSAAGYGVQFPHANFSRYAALAVGSDLMYYGGVSAGPCGPFGCTAVAFLSQLRVPQTCAGSVTPLSGTTVSGELTTTDNYSPIRGSYNYYCDRYSFEGRTGQRVAISLSSSAFDTYLYLLGPSGSVIAENDDGGGGWNSRIPPTSGYFTLTADGTYVIEVTSYSSGSTGPYTLTLSAPPDCVDSVSPAAISIAAAGGSGTVAVAAASWCSWTAASGASWLTIVSGSSGTGSGAVQFSVGPNPGPGPRTGQLTIGGRRVTVEQLAPAAAPGAPSGLHLQLSAGRDNIIVTWEAVSGATSYNLYMAEEPGVSKSNWQSKPGGMKHEGVTSPFVHPTPLSPGRTYCFVVTAVSEGGESAESPESCLTLPPAPPRGLTATAGDGSVTLVWSPSEGASSYNVYLAEECGLTPENYGSRRGGRRIEGVSRPYTVTGLTNGTSYCFIVTAVNAGGESGPSDEAQATPEGGAPPAPQGCQDLVTSEDATVTRCEVVEAPPGAPGGFSAREAVSFTLSDVVGSANVCIQFAEVPASPAAYKVVGGAWQQIYPGDETEGVANVSLDAAGRRLCFTIEDNSPADADAATSVISDPVVLGSLSGGSQAGGGQADGQPRQLPRGGTAPPDDSGFPWAGVFLLGAGLGLGAWVLAGRGLTRGRRPPNG